MSDKCVSCENYAAIGADACGDCVEKLRAEVASLRAALEAIAKVVTIGPITSEQGRQMLALTSLASRALAGRGPDWRGLLEAVDRLEEVSAPYDDLPDEVWEEIRRVAAKRKEWP